tara:strand:- start:541 stop:771 length:231 start_codon:yes stop_codon:yes gene_type:complete
MTYLIEVYRKINKELQIHNKSLELNLDYYKELFESADSIIEVFKQGDRLPEVTMEYEKQKEKLAKKYEDLLSNTSE